MISTKLASMGLAATLAAVLPAIPAQAASLTRTFVSSAGHDSNPCTITEPCATFAVAYAATAASGIIAALDPGKYGPLTITRAVTVNGYGWAAITGPASGNAITINAVSGNVTLTGLEIDGAGAATNGIQFTSGSNLTIRDSKIQNFTGNGVSFLPGASSGISVSLTLVSNNGGAGIMVQPQGTASATADFEQVQTQYNIGNYGILIDASATTGAIKATATDSISSNNGGGFIAEATLPGTTLLLVRCTASNNHTGVQAGSTSSGADNPKGTVLMSQVAIFGNVVGWQNQGEGLLSFGDNVIEGNLSANTAPPSTTKK
jgi:hypothetical protein